jgi:HlyD family secretion protein
MEITVRRSIGLALIVVAAGCARNKEKTPNIQTQTVQRRTIVIDAEATGSVEPIAIVEVKSKASGQITKMPVETGTMVKPGDLLVQIDTRDVQSQYNQAEADLRAAEAKMQVSAAQKKRSDEMFNSRVITATEHESATLDYANADAQVVRARAALDLAKQRLEDATITAPVSGTVIDKTVTLGQVITSATGNASGGTTLLKMADLNQVRVRALFNETDIGQVRPGQEATVVTDAYPDRPFRGIVEKIEPQAVIQQNVTMFPVLVTLSNLEGLLKPGMNGEVTVVIDQRDDVLAVPNDAIKNVREGVAIAPVLGLDPDSVQAQIRAQFGGRGGFGRNGGAQQTGTTSGAAQPNGARTNVAQGDVELAGVQQDPQQGGRQFQMPDVSDADCAKINAALAKRPADKKKLDDLAAQRRDPNADRRAIGEQMRAIYTAAGVDARMAGACRFKEMRAQGTGNAAPGAGAGNRGQSNQQVAGVQPGGANRNRQGSVRPGAQAGQPPLQLSTPENGATRARPRSGLVFVADGNSFKPRIVMLGAGNFDYTEVVSGLQEGDKVAMLASAALQAQRMQQNDRMRQGMGVPGLSGAPNAGRGGPGGGAAGGGGGAGRGGR